MTGSLCLDRLGQWKHDSKYSRVCPNVYAKRPKQKTIKLQGGTERLILSCCGRSGCVVPGLLVLLENPLSLTVSGTRLHLHHYLIEVDEIGRAGRGATFLVRLFHRSAELEASSVLHVVYKLPQAFVRGSL